MIVKLLTSTQSIQDMERFAAIAALTCHANQHFLYDEGYIPSDTLKNIIKRKHESILEHINLTFSIQGLSRACLQELARHRHISLSVESTRHTLRKQINDDDFIYNLLNSDNDFGLSERVDAATRIGTVSSVVRILKNYPDMTNDELKYFLPEFWPTNLIITLNIREFRHILDLRTAPAALKEFRDLARAMFNEIPEQFRYLLQDCVHEESKNGK